MDRNTFIKELSLLNTAYSVTGKQYGKIRVSGNKVLFVREKKVQSEHISISELFQFYCSGVLINTTNAKTYISGRVQSPAVAIIKALTTNPKLKETFKPLKSTLEKVIEKDEDSKDETKFFLALSDLLGEEYLLSKSIGKPVNSGHIFFSNNYKAYSLPSKFENAYTNLLEALKSDLDFSGNSISHYIDGLIINHPTLSNRIVEFDEEQHFTPARKETLKELSLVCDNNYIDHYKSICNDLDYLNREVLTKNRINLKLEQVPENFTDFVNWLESKNLKESGYIKSKNGFPFLGGRIAQRAYYDTLRDTAHLSPLNKDFSSPLRFAKKNIEDMANKPFKLISREELKRFIGDFLKETYQLNLR